MTNKQWQICGVICIIFVVMFSILSLITMDLLFQRCDVLEEHVYNLQTEIRNLEEWMDIHIQDYWEFQESIEQLNEPVVQAEIIVEEEEPTFDYDYDYVLRVVTHECIGEPLEGQMAVAQCIRTTSEVTGMTPEEVVKQVNKNGTRQYATPWDIEDVTDSIREACERVFVNGESVVDEPIRYFYSIRNGGYSKWHENSLEYVTTIGNHKFFKTKD